jgi:hypothetical protein
MKPSKIRPGIEVIRSYAEYGDLIDGFFRGCYQLLVVVGRPGLAKSYEFEQRLGSSGHLIKGWAAPLQAYIEAYRHRNRPLVFDDAEVLWKRPGGRILIRSLTEHRPKKLVQWKSTAKELAKAAVPQSFYTTSKIAIIANRFAFGSEEEREAVLDRGHLVLFDPSPVEVHERVGDWFWCQEIYDYIGERLHMLDSPSSRTYLKAWERKEAGGDWQKLIADVFCHNNGALLLQALESDPDCATVDDRVQKFIEQTGLSRATYFNIKRGLRNSDQLQPPGKLEVPRKVLHASPPSLDDLTDEAEHDVIDGDPNGPRSQATAPWCGYSDDPNDYANYADYLADWWKRPQSAEDSERTAEETFANDIDRLRHELRKAIEREDYESAADLRDEIQKLNDSQDTNGL